jgi:hypothetical protein
MPKQWGRLYTGTRHHPSIRRLRQECPDSWWIWYPLLEMAIEMDNDGYVDHKGMRPMSFKQLADEVGIRESKFTKTVLVMEKLKLITFFEKHLIVSSYNERQYKSDYSTERVRKYRESLERETPMKRYGNVSETELKRPRDRDRDIIKDKKTCASDNARESKYSKNGFDKFWQAYPKKKGKGAAEKAFNNAKKLSDFNLDAIIMAIEKQKKSQDWKKDGGQFIPHPSTWINQKRWLDEEGQSQIDDYDAYMESVIEKNQRLFNGE